MAVFVPKLCPLKDYQDLLKGIREMGGGDGGGSDGKYKCVKTKIRVVKDGVQITAHSTFIFNLLDKEVLLNEDQVGHYSDPSYQDLICEKIPTFFAFVRGQSKPGLELAFTAEAKRPVYLPINRSVAAGVILAFYNGMRDPVEKIMSMYGADTEDASDEISRILVTYYMCCLKYLTGVDLNDVVVEGSNENLAFMIDDQTCVPTVLQDKYLRLKETEIPIHQGTVAFHAVYGAYVLCRPVANKQEFRQWILKRYNAFLSSIHETTELNIQMDLQAGGTRVNNLAISRPTLRKAVFNIIKGNYTDIRTAAIKNHVKMLTALSGMTTYSLVQRVIATGGSILFMKPLPSQIISFMAEKKEIEDLITEKGYNKDEIIFIHLFMPNIQCFRSAQYADLVVTASAIEEHTYPSSKTLERYRAKTEGVTINIKHVKAFLAAQSTSISCSIDGDTKEKMRELFGDSMEAMLEDAERVVKIINRQARLESI
ncbi:unnamed protein product [Spodoptera exigua]|nr:unnamed protein product [Spodoptera exigua]